MISGNYRLATRATIGGARRGGRLLKYHSGILRSRPRCRTNCFYGTPMVQKRMKRQANKLAATGYGNPVTPPYFSYGEAGSTNVSLFSAGERSSTNLWPRGVGYVLPVPVFLEVLPSDTGYDFYGVGDTL